MQSAAVSETSLHRYCGMMTMTLTAAEATTRSFPENEGKWGMMESGSGSGSELDETGLLLLILMLLCAVYSSILTRL